MSNNINHIILDWMIAERELLLKMQEKERAVRIQDFKKAAILLEEQRAIEARLPTLEQLHELKKQYQPATDDKRQATGGNAGADKG